MAATGANTPRRISGCPSCAPSTVLLLRGAALRGTGLEAAGRIQAGTGVRLVCDTFAPVTELGVGRVPVERLPYLVEQADFVGIHRHDHVANQRQLQPAAECRTIQRGQHRHRKITQLPHHLMKQRQHLRNSPGRVIGHLHARRKKLFALSAQTQHPHRCILRRAAQHTRKLTQQCHVEHIDRRPLKRQRQQAVLQGIFNKCEISHDGCKLHHKL